MEMVKKLYALFSWPFVIGALTNGAAAAPDPLSTEAAARPDPLPTSSEVATTKKTAPLAHLSIGAGLAPIGIREKGTHDWYVAISAMPQFKLGITMDSDDRCRLEGSVRWTEYTKLIDGQQVNAMPASGEPIMGLLGLSFRVSSTSSATQAVTTAVQRVTFGFGYGNVPLDGDRLVTGHVFMIALESDLISYNFVEREW